MASLEQTVRNLQDETRDVLLKKNHDYGSENITMTGLSGLTTRMQDKVSRLKNMTQKGTIPFYEKPRQDFMDLANYGLIGMMMIDGTWEGSVPQYERDMTKPLMVYLAGPIDGVSTFQSHGWRGEASSRLVKNGATVFDPSLAFCEGITRPDAIRAINRAAVASSDVVLANISGPGRGFGTIREIEFAASIGIPVLAIVPQDFESVDRYDIQCCHSLEQALDILITQMIQSIQDNPPSVHTPEMQRTHQLDRWTGIGSLDEDGNSAME